MKGLVRRSSLTLSLALLFTCGYHIVKGGGPAGPDTRHVNAVLTGDLAGDGRMLRVEFYYRDLAQSSGSGQPTEYVRGVVVTGPDKNSPALERWESQPTTITAFYPELNKLWQVPPRGMLITTAVQYGGRFMKLYALRWEGGKLRERGAWEGENFSIEGMGARQRLVVIARPSDYNRVPELYAWTGAKFMKANRQFPSFFSKLGASYLEAIRAAQSLPPAALVQDCRLALEAYQLAGTPSHGRNACLAAKERIAQGSALAPSCPGGSPQQFEQEKNSAVTEIDRLLERFKPTQGKSNTGAGA